MIKTLVFLCLTLSLSAQTPDYFDNSPEWRQSSACAVGLPCIENQEYVYYINGDSTVGDMIYKKVFKHGTLVNQWYDGPPVPPSCDNSWTFNQFYALVRQEESRIYIRQWGDQEALLYDFDFEVGDTLPVTWNQWHEDIVVTSIDSLLVGDAYRRVFNLTQQSSPQLIEGIGHEGGFFEPFPPILECGHALLCFALDAITYYPNLNDPCDLTVSIKRMPDQEAFKFYPNPVTTELSIEKEFAESIEQIVVYNTIGQKMPTLFRQVGSNLIKIDLSGLEKGMYIIQMIENRKATLSFKVLKE